MDHPEILDSLFHDAVSAIDAGDISELECLLAAHPELVRERLESPGAWLRDKVGNALDGFFKQPYLLWFVSEDPVRNGKLPENIGQVARTIIEAAKSLGVDSLHEQLDYALHLAICSSVAREGGRQIELIDVLIDAGATIDDGKLEALVCRNLTAAEHLLRRGARLTLATAACLERWDDVGRLAQSCSAEDKQIALAAAALNGNAQALATLIELGIDVSAFSSGFYTHATPLHHAVCSGCLEAVKVLVEAGASLDTKDTAWQVTPLGWAKYYRHAMKTEEDTTRYDEIAAYLREKEIQA